MTAKYRPYRTTVDGKRVWKEPKPEPDGLFFVHYHHDGKRPQPRSLYVRLTHQFSNLLASIQMDG